MPKVRVKTIVQTRGTIEGFAQDGNKVVWGDLSQRSCARLVQLRDLRTGKTWGLTGNKGPTCRNRLESGLQHSMALAGTRALWASVRVSNSAYHFQLSTAAPGQRERDLGDVHISGGLADEGPFRPLPMAGTGSTLAYADISDAEEQDPVGVFAVGRGTTLLSDTQYTVALAASDSRIALARQLPAGCVCALWPSWSPDGTRIAFTSGANGNNDILREAHLVDAAGGPASRVALGSAGVSALEWSPTGSSLLFLRDNGLYVVSPEGGTPKLLARVASASTSFAWSPDGRDVAYTRFERGGTYIFVVSASGGAPRRIAKGSGPQWSPDGRSLLAAREDGTYIVPLDGSPARKLYASEGSSYAWASDGSLIAYSDWDIHGTYVIHPDGTGRRRISATAATEWSPDSSRLVGTSSGALVVVAADGSGEQRLGPRGYWPVWSPDGTTIAYVSDEEESMGELAAIGPDGSGKRLVTSTKPAPDRSLVEFRRRNGALLSSFAISGVATAIATDGRHIALLLNSRKPVLEVRASTGRVVYRQALPKATTPNYLGLSGRWIAYHAGKAIRLLDWRTGRESVLASVRSPVGLSVEGKRVAWAEQRRKGSSIRAAVLP